MFSGIPTTTFGVSIVMCHLSLLVSARVLDDFRGISCFVIFNVTRAVLETLPSHAHWVALCVTACRCEVATNAATFCSLVEKTPWARESVETF